MSPQYRLLSLAREILRSDILRENKQGMSGPALRFVIEVDLLLFKELLHIFIRANERKFSGLCSLKIVSYRNVPIIYFQFCLVYLLSCT